MAQWVPTVGLICPVCESRMTLAKTVKGFFTLPQLRTYECRRCAVLATVEDARSEDYTVH